MNIMKAIIGLFLLIGFAFTNAEFAFPQDDQTLEKMAVDEELEQEFKWLKAETYVITASKVKETIKKAPASITVITDKQIRQMGATALFDVVRAVPGFFNHYIFYGSHWFAVRGGIRSWSASVLVMINGHPINNAADEGVSWVHDTLILDNIKRIEFIRGPGSALYGANAYHGVINIITKDAEDIEGFELTARGGSWDTQQYNLLYGKTFSGLEVAFNFNYFKTHGYRAFIEKDFQTFSDWLFGSSASLAPGRTNGDDEKYDLALNLKYKGFTFDGRYVDREVDRPFSFWSVLTQKHIDSLKDYYLNLSYEKALLEGLDFSGKVYRNLVDYGFDHQDTPPGFVYGTPDPPFFAVWSEGLLSEPSGKASRTGIEIQAKYKINDSNIIVAGGTYEEQKWYDTKGRANYLFTDDPFVLIQLPSVQEVPSLDAQKRNFKAFFLEHIWDITDDIRLTTGVRYDDYSDFGSEVSPRVGLTWEYIKGYDLKLLYGHAFRAPTFDEIFLSLGYGLDPETIDTYEVSLGAEFTSSFSGRVTLFHREEEDLIWNTTGLPTRRANLGESRAQGFEVETKYDFGKGTYISGYYEYLSVKEGPGDSFYHAQLMANVRLSRYLNFNADCHHYDGFNRVAGDPRDDPSSLTLVNATLIAKKFLKGYEGLELRGSVYNLLDKDGTWLQENPFIPHDFPIPGINFLLEIKYKF